MAPVQYDCPNIGPIDLSMKAKRKLRLEEFLRQNLDEVPARNVIQWVDRNSGLFRILWTHQSSGTFTQEHASLFRYWAVARGKSPELSSVELKQSLRMALNKSPYVKRITAHQYNSDYRYFCFTRDLKKHQAINSGSSTHSRVRQLEHFNRHHHSSNSSEPFVMDMPDVQQNRPQPNVLSYFGNYDYVKYLNFERLVFKPITMNYQQLDVYRFKPT